MNGTYFWYEVIQKWNLSTNEHLILLFVSLTIFILSTYWKFKLEEKDDKQDDKSDDSKQ